MSTSRNATSKRPKKPEPEWPFYRILDLSCNRVVATTYGERDVKSLVDRYTVSCVVGVEAFYPFVLEDPLFGTFDVIAHVPCAPFQA